MIKEGIHLNSIYQHYKKGDYYKTIDVVYDHETQKPYVIYSKCDINGVYISIRSSEASSEAPTVKQPFSRSVADFTTIICGLSDCGSDVKAPRFKFIKEL
jgi:hypothetical protein